MSGAAGREPLVSDPDLTIHVGDVRDVLPPLVVIDGVRCCSYCGGPLPPVKPCNERKQRFCRRNHHTSWWQAEHRRRDRELEAVA